MLYSPPGTSATGAKSTADYASSSSTGISTSSSGSFKDTYGVTATASGNLFVQASASVGFEASSVSGSTDELAVTKTDGMDLKPQGLVRPGGTSPAAHQEVLLKVGGRTYRTFTNAKGEYYFYKTPRGAGSVSVSHATQPVIIGDKPVLRDLKP